MDSTNPPSDYETPVSKTESDDFPLPLLQTKLHRPPIAGHIIPRAQLIEELEKGAVKPVTLIAAPAGYGKSILASQWLELSKFPGAWISLDENDNDLRLFLEYVFEAVHGLFPQRKLSSKIILNAAELPPVSVISRYFLNDLQALPDRFILVLDDFHYIHEAAIHDFMGELLVHPSPIIHLALLTRRDPPLALTSLRSRGMLTEITTAQLRFSVLETKSFMELFLHIAVADKTAQILEKKLEGWVTGLHLAALSIKGEADQDRLTAGLMETSHYVQDYLIQEVISHVPPQFRLHLLQTAMLDRFCAPLCDALSTPDTGRNHTEPVAAGKAFIDWLVKAHLFVIHLDTKKRWFRYHHLFQELIKGQLKKRVSAKEIEALHSRASEWFERKDLIDESIHHALEAGDPVRAAEIVERHRHDEIIQDRWYVLGRWLGLLPPEIIQQRAALLLTRVWQCFNQFQLSKIPPLLEQANELLKNETVDESLLGELDFHWGYLSIWLQGDGESALKRLELARKRLPKTHKELLVETEFDIALARHMIGEGAAEIRSLEERIQTTITADHMLMTRLVAAQVFIFLMSGDLERALAPAQKLRSVAEESGNLHAMGWGDYLLALIHLQSLRLDKALQRLGFAAEEKEILHRKVAVEILVGQVITYQAMERTNDAVVAMKQLLEFAQGTNDPQHVTVAKSCQARLSLLQGDLKPAYRWARSFNAEPHAPSAIFWLEVPLITQARVWIASGRSESLEMALASLGSLRQQGTVMHLTCLTIEIAILQSMALEKLGRTNEALKTLEEVLTLAKPGGWIRPFVEVGPPMAGLLVRLRKKNIAVDHINRILAVFPEGEQAVTPALFDQTSKSPHPPLSPSPGLPAAQPLVEPLTNRELDVLELLTQRLQNKEIADKLSISPVTVKSHLKNIYQKLNTANRREAVEKAKVLGVL